MTTCAPIALFVYNRPWHTQQTVESLQKNRLSDQSNLFIFSDGPKDENSRENVEKVREYIKTINGFKNVTIMKRDSNFGLAKSIVNGVTDIVNQYGKVIVLEDDLALSSHFLKYMNDALEIYQAIPKVMHISGYIFPIKIDLPETFFYRGSSCWGWATWKRAWKKFEFNASRLLEAIKNKSARWEFDIRGTRKYYKMLKNETKGRPKSWAVRWYASIYVNDGLCLHPGHSLVNNIGHDSTGVHCVETEKLNANLSETKITYFERDIRENEDVLREIMVFLKSLDEPFYTRLLKKLTTYKWN